MSHRLAATHPERALDSSSRNAVRSTPGSDARSPTSARRGLFVLLNVAGGLAVLGSYALWLSSPAHDGPALWGRLGGGARTLYTLSMLAAAAGYFAVFGHLLRREIPRRSPDAFGVLQTTFALVLFPSALWMPLAFEYLAAPSPAVWWAMRVTLWVVGAASVALLAILLRLGADEPSPGRTVAIVGAAAFSFQTAVLDAFVWPLYFPG